MIYVTDTHSFLWYLSEDPRLSKNAKLIFDGAESGQNVILVPTIVLAESLHIIEDQKFPLILFKDVIRKVDSGLNYAELPLDMNVIKKLEEFNKLTEMHDRIIAASASVINTELITKDRIIKDTGYIRTVW